MDKQLNLNDIIHSAIDRFVLSKTCYIGDGTGNVLRYKNRIYIVTCGHITDEIFKSNDFEVILQGNNKLKKEKLKYRISTTSKIDISLIEILDSGLNVDYYTLDNFEFIEDFKKANFSKSNFFLLGYPDKLSFKTEKGKNLVHMSYMTRLKNDKPITKDFLFVDYNRSVESNRIIQTELNYNLPHPGGMSGSFLFQVKVFEVEQNKVWSPSTIKVVGIQQSFDRIGNWIKCSNIKYLRDLLAANVKE
jgi:hypothetical protein